MQNLATLLACLDQDYSIDFWSDFQILYASELANKLTEADWEKICETWKAFPERVQERIAQLSSGIDDWHVCIGKMLIEMLSSPNPELVETSLDSLNSIAQCTPDHLPVSQLLPLVEHMEVTGYLSNIVLDSLKRILRGISKE